MTTKSCCATLSDCSLCTGWTQSPWHYHHSLGTMSQTRLLWHTNTPLQDKHHKMDRFPRLSNRHIVVFLPYSFSTYIMFCFASTLGVSLNVTLPETLGRNPILMSQPATGVALGWKVCGVTVTQSWIQLPQIDYTLHLIYDWHERDYRRV